MVCRAELNKRLYAPTVWQPQARTATSKEAGICLSGPLTHAKNSRPLAEKRKCFSATWSQRGLPPAVSRRFGRDQGAVTHEIYAITQARDVVVARHRTGHHGIWRRRR